MGSLDLRVRRNTSLKVCRRQERVGGIYNNWQAIFEDSPAAVNAERRNGQPTADYDQEPQYSSDRAG